MKKQLQLIHQRLLMPTTRGLRKRIRRKEGRKLKYWVALREECGAEAFKKTTTSEKRKEKRNGSVTIKGILGKGTGVVRISSVDWNEKEKKKERKSFDFAFSFCWHFATA